jgi:hypothetical protein
MRRLTPIAGIGMLALVLFVAAVATYLASDRFDAWAPNAATEAISVFVTVFVVGWLLRREEERRIRPRREYALESVDYMLHMLVTSIVGDYIETHPHREVKVAPNLEAVLDFCAASLKYSEEDAPRRYYDGVPGIVNAAKQCAESFDRIRRDDVDVLPSKLDVALREVARGLRGANSLYTMVGPPDDESRSRIIDSDIAREIVDAAREFLSVYRAETDADIALTEEDLERLTGIGIMARQHAIRRERAAPKER